MCDLYASMLADLYAQRERLDRAIAAVEELCKCDHKTNGGLVAIEQAVGGGFAVIASDVAGPPRIEVPQCSVTLSLRQQQIFDLLITGLSNKEIARKLEAAEATVKVHVKAIFRRLGVSSRSKLLAQYHKSPPGGAAREL